MKSKNGGFTLIPIILIVIVLIVVLFKFPKPQTNNIASPGPLATAHATFIPSPTPTPSPSQSPSPSPTFTPTKAPTPKPTIAPSSGTSVPVTVTSSNSVWTFDLGTTKVITDTGNDGDCGSNCTVLNLQTYVTRNGGSFGVNGTYFCPSTYPDCASKSNSYDFPVYNTRLNKWINQGNLFWNSRSIIYFNGTSGYFMQNAKDFSGGVSAAIVNHPGLLAGGNVQIDENQSGLSSNQKAKGTKVGIGLIGNSKVMVMVSKNVTMREFALTFKNAGATDALNLDVGGSLAVYSGGRYVYGPGRDIPNAIIFAPR